MNDSFLTIWYPGESQYNRNGPFKLVVNYNLPREIVIIKPKVKMLEKFELHVEKL